MRMLRMNQSKISRPQPSAQTIRVCARDALFCQISNMAEDFSAVYLFIVLSAFAHLFYTKMLYLESLSYSSKILVLKFLYLELVKVTYGIRRAR